MIQNATFDEFRNGEFVKFFTNVSNIAESHDPAALKIDSQVGQLGSVFAKLKTLYKLERGSKLTPEMVAYDKQRDDAFAGIREITKAYASKHANETLRNQAKTLLELLNKHGRVTILGYQEESAALDDIIDKIDNSTSLTDTLDALNLNDWYAELKASHQKFDETYLARNKEYAAAPEESMMELRKMTEAAWTDVKNHTISHATITPSEAYTAFIKEVNALTDSYNQTVANRKNNPDDTEETDEDFEEVGE